MRKNTLKLKPKTDFVLRAFLSVVLAFLLWAFAITNTDPVITQTYDSVPITFQNADTLTANGLVYESSINSISVELYGRTLQISKLSASDIYAVVDLSNITAEGNYSIEIAIKGIGNNISVVNISPQYLSITVGTLTTEEQNYSIELSGDVESGYDVIGYSADVSEVEASGSSAMLASIETIKGTVDIQGQNTDFTSTVTLQAYDKDENVLDKVNIYPQEVNVSVNIGQLKTVPVSVATTGVCAMGYTITDTAATPNEISVIIDEDVVDYDTIGSLKTKTIDVSGRSATFTADIGLIFNNGVYATNASVVSARITIGETERKTFTYNTIQVRNTPADINCAFPSFTSVTVTVTGQTDILSSLKEDQITVYVDLAEYAEIGTYEPEIQVDMPNDITFLEISEKTVTVVLSEK